jgi:integrase
MVGAFLASSQRSKSRDWVYQLEVKLNKAFRHLEKLHPREVRRGHIEPVLDRLFNEGNSACSVNEYRKIIISVLNYGVAMEALEVNVAAGIPKVPEDETDVEPIPTAHLKQLILGADGRFSDLIAFISLTGARFVEASRLRKGEVFLDGDSPYCLLSSRKHRGGGLRKRPQPLSEMAAAIMRRSIARPGEFVFPGVDGGQMKYQTELNRLQDLCEKLGFKGPDGEPCRYSFHPIRHWAGTIATQMGKSKKAVAKFLGHSNTGATERYMHVLEPEMWEVARRLEAEMAQPNDGGGAISGAKASEIG